jgi:hypothetical protein
MTREDWRWPSNMSEADIQRQKDHQRQLYEAKMRNTYNPGEELPESLGGTKSSGSKWNDNWLGTETNPHLGPWAVANAYGKKSWMTEIWWVHASLGPIKNKVK